MGKAGKWIKSFLVGGKKEKHSSSNHHSNAVAGNPTTTVVISPATSKEKKRWSFRRSSATAPGPKDPNTNATAPSSKDSNTKENTPTKAAPPASSESPQREQKRSDLTAVAADIAAEQDAVEIHQMEVDDEEAIFIEEAAATRIQSVFRSYLARKALRALRGLVKLQALVRGHLVRKQAKATLRCMQALVTAQARARAQRIRAVDEGMLYENHRHSTQRINGHDYNFRNSYPEVEKGVMEENIKIVEMDLGESNSTSKATRSSYSNHHNNGRMDGRFSDPYAQQFDYANQDYQKISPAPSAITDISPRTCSGHFEDYPFNTAQSSPQCYYTAISKPDPSRTPFVFPHQEYTESLSYEYPAYPSYMANTQSSRAKARSQSAPKQRPESFERQLSRRRPSVEGRNIPRAVRMQRSSSHVGSAAQNYQYPWSIKLDKSMVSLKDSECGSTCSVFTNTNYCRSVVSYDPQGIRY